MDVYEEESSEISIKNLDHLGLVAGMVDELGIVEMIDTLIPSGAERILSHGEGIKAMILNGLGYVNKQLYQTPRFFEDKPLERLFGKPLEATQINADTLSRTLDACFDYGVTELFGKIAAKAAGVLGLTCKQLHLDSTSFHLHGTYESRNPDASNQTQAAQTPQEASPNPNSTPVLEENTDDEAPTPITITHGYSRDHRFDLPQVILSLIVENEAGLPLFMQPLSGNINDKEGFNTIVKEHICALQSAAACSILVADAALYSSNTLGLLHEQQRPFISRVPTSLKEAKALIAQAKAVAFTPIDENYRYHEVESHYGDVKQRWILIQSSAAKSADDQSALRAMKQMRATEEKTCKQLCKRTFACSEEAQAALDSFTAEIKAHKVAFSDITHVLRYEGKGRPGSGQTPIGHDYGIGIRLEESEEYATLLTEQSGLFILATTTDLTPQEVLREYKAQQRVERGFRFLKSPEFLSDGFFVKKPERIEALLMIMTLCLLVYAALEHRARTALKSTEPFFPDLKGKKPTRTPTARWVFASFFAIHVFTLAGTTEQIAGMKPFQNKLLELLGSRFVGYYRRGKLKC